MFPVSPYTIYAEGQHSIKKLDKEVTSSTNGLLNSDSISLDIEYTEEEIILFADKEEEEIKFYETNKVNESEQPLLMIEDDTDAILLTQDEEQESETSIEGEYLFIRYTVIDEEAKDPEEKEMTYEGYVHHSHVILLEDAETYREEREKNLDNSKVDEDNSSSDNEDEKSESTNDEKSSNHNDSQTNEKSEGESNKDEQSNEDAKKETKESSIMSSNKNEIINGDSDAKVVQLKKDLATLGFPVPGSGTPLFGSSTELKVKEFQTYYNLTVTGTLNVETENKINAILA